MPSVSERTAAEFGMRSYAMYFVYVAILAVVDMSALLHLVPQIPDWCHLVVTLSLSMVALVVIAISMRMKHKQGEARGETIRKLLEDVERLSRARPS